MLIAAALLVQTTLIIEPFFERRCRRSAEATSRDSLGELAQLSRIATAGLERSTCNSRRRSPDHPSIQLCWGWSVAVAINS
jgi:hypothetical protein